MSPVPPEWPDVAALLSRLVADPSTALAERLCRLLDDKVAAGEAQTAERTRRIELCEQVSRG